MSEFRASHSPSSESPSNYFRLPPLYALIIGINAYASPNWPDLNVAVQDANDFEHYLTTRLHVPQSNIINLRNAGATRSAILNAFQTLKDLTSTHLKPGHSNIAAEDVGIIVFFSGHGTRGEKPEEWKDWATFDNYYEAICPADMGTKENDTDEVPAIPDRTIAALVNQLSEARGNNITLIFDCCNSAGINRTQTEADRKGYIPRYAPNPPRLPHNYDDSIIGTLSRGLAVPQSVVGKNQSSHVLLAACGREQQAYEHPNQRNSVFTHALLKVLNRVNIETLTYTSFMHRLNMPSWQDAHCDGVEIDRRLFNARIKGGDPSLIPSIREDTHLIMDAGSIQGVAVGSLIAVHASNLYSLPQQPNNPLPGLLTVTAVDDNSSTIQLSQDSMTVVPARGRVYCRIIIASHALSLSSNDLTWLKSVFTDDFCSVHRVSIVRGDLATPPADIELTLIQNDDIVLIDHRFPLAAKHIGTRSPFHISAKDTSALHRLVRHALHFRFHLLRTNTNIKESGGIKVTVDMRELNEKWISKHKSVVNPVGDNVFATDPGTVIIDDDDDDDEEEDKTYGVVIENLTNTPLYPHLFYFDPSELSITSWYTPPKGSGISITTHKTTPPLAPKSKFSIGYGTNDGLNPWSFYIRPNESKDVGFFKLFLTTTPTNLDCIVQDSAFASQTMRGEGQGEQEESVDESEFEKVVWDEMVMTVVQLRK